MKRLIVVIFLAASWGVALPCLATPVTDAIAQSDTLATNSKFEEAQALIEGQLKTNVSAKERSDLTEALADVYFVWGTSFWPKQDFERAIFYYKKAYQLNETSVSALQFFILLQLGDANRNLKRHDEAIRYYSKALPLIDGLKDDKDVKDRESLLLLKMGMSYSSLGREEEALRSYARCLTLLRAAKDKPHEATTLIWEGDSYANLSRYEESLADHNLALTIFRELKDRRNEAIMQNKMGGTYWKMSRYSEALTHFELSLPIYREVKDKVGELSALSNLGGLYRTLGRPMESLRYYQPALQISREINGTQGNEDANLLNNIGILFQDAGGYEDAIKYYNMALTSARALNDRALEGTILSNLGATYHALKRDDEALTNFNLALKLQQGSSNKVAQSAALTNIGIVYAHSYRYDEALRYYYQALTLNRATKDRGGEAATLNNIMMTFKRESQPRLAIFYGKQAINVFQSIRRDLQTLNKESQKAFAQNHKGVYERLAGVLIEAGRLPEAEQVTRLLKQSETFDFVRRDADISALPEALSLNAQEKQYLQRYGELGEQTTTLGERIAILEAKRPSERNEAEKAELVQLRADQDALNGRWEIFRRELALAFAPSKTGAAQVEKVDVAASDAWQKALQKLEAGGNGPTVLLSTVIAPDRFYIVLTSAHGHQQFSYAIKDSELNTLVSRLRAALTDPTRDPVPNAKKLYDVVFCNGDLEKALQKLKTHTVLWSLSGSLRYIPLETLHDGEGYLLERDRINAVMTLTSKDYFEVPKGGDALAVGTSQAHTVELKDEKGTAQQLNFAPLAQVPSEVRGIIKEADKGGTGPLSGELLLDSDFTSKALVSALDEGYSTVHIATHFRLQPGDDRTSFLLLGDGSPLPVFDWKVKMPLSGVELLTLSACETGVSGDTTPKDGEATSKTEATGVEVGSLGEIAQRLGAASIIASLWPVADNSTSLLMRDFYTRWQAHPQLGKGQALRQAQRALLTGATALTDKNAPERGMVLTPAPGTSVTPIQAFRTDPKRPYAHPFYWAPFFLTGNWR